MAISKQAKMPYTLEVDEYGHFIIKDEQGNKLVYLKDSLSVVQRDGIHEVTITLPCTAINNEIVLTPAQKELKKMIENDLEYAAKCINERAEKSERKMMDMISRGKGL